MSVIETGIATSLGNGVKTKKFTVDSVTMAAIIGAAVSGDVPLFTLPQGGKVIGVTVKHTVQFAGVGGTLKVSVGKAGTATHFTAATADLVATAVADTALQETNMYKSGQQSALPVVLNCVSSSGNVTALTAGSVDVTVTYLNVSTPGA